MKHVFILFVLLAVYSNGFANFNITRQDNWRWRNSDGSETSAKWKAGQNTSITIYNNNEVLRLRMGILTVCYYSYTQRDSLQFTTDTSVSSSWKNIGNDINNPFIMARSNNYVQQDQPTTSQLTTTSSIPFTAGKIMVSDSVIAGIASSGNSHTEFEWVIKASPNLSPNTTYYFRQRGLTNFYPNFIVYPSLTTGTTFGNKAPIISIVSPAHDTSYTAPATFTIRAEASDLDGTVSSVKFYNGSTYLKTDFISPYSYTLPDLAAGTYTLTAKATDNLGAETVSAAVKITVKAGNKAPTVSITSPIDNAVYTAPATVTVNAKAADSDGTVSSVKFYNGSTYLKTDFTSPYSYTLSNLAAGTYTLTAKATDNLGAGTTSDTVTVKVVNGSIVSNKPYPENEKTAPNDAFGLKLSPNPANNIVNIQTSGLQTNKPATLSIISVLGNVLKTIQISKAATQLDVSTLTSGVYTLKILNDDKVSYKQFVKW